MAPQVGVLALMLCMMDIEAFLPSTTFESRSLNHQPISPIRSTTTSSSKIKASWSPQSAVTEQPWYEQEIQFIDDGITSLAAAAAARKAPKAPPQEFKIGIIVVDHGSRRQDANRMLDGVTEQFREVSGYELVEPAHMELAEPSIATAFGRCVEQGATFIICHPFFLSRGRHVMEDIPTLMEEAASIFPGVNWALSEPLGIQAEIPKLMQLAVSECIQNNNIRSQDHAQQEEPDLYHNGAGGGCCGSVLPGHQGEGI